MNESCCENLLLLVRVCFLAKYSELLSLWIFPITCSFMEHFYNLGEYSKSWPSNLFDPPNCCSAWQVVRGKSGHFQPMNSDSKCFLYSLFILLTRIIIISQFSVSIKSTCIHIFPLSAASLYHYLFPDPDSLVWIFLARQTLFRVSLIAFFW